MADVVITNTIGAAREGAAHDALVWTDTLTAYMFYVSGLTDLVYRRTMDGGVTWGGEVTVATSAVAINHFSVWYDRWTTGDPGQLIHIGYIRNLADGTYYLQLDTADDSLGLTKTVAVFVNNDPTASYSTSCLAITKARGGNLYIAYHVDPAGPREGFYRSVDGGASWVSRALVTEGVLVDKYFLLPGNEADDQDVWCFYWDSTPADELSLKTYDNSGDSWSEQSIDANIKLSSAIVLQMSGSVRHSDNHAIVCVMSRSGATSGDLRVYDVNGAASITAKTDVYSAELNHLACALTIDQNTDRLYVSFDGDPGDAFPNGLRMRYRISDDGATSWGAVVIYGTAPRRSGKTGRTVALTRSGEVAGS